MRGMQGQTRGIGAPIRRNEDPRLLRGLGSFVDALWAYYRRPEFLAYMQVMLNLSHDPTTADSTQAALKSVGVRVVNASSRIKIAWKSTTSSPV